MNYLIHFEEGQVFSYYNSKQHKYHQLVISKVLNNRVAAIFDDGSVLDFDIKDVIFERLTFLKKFETWHEAVISKEFNKTSPSES